MLMIDLVPRAFRGPSFHFLREKPWRRVKLMRQKFACTFTAALLISLEKPSFVRCGEMIFRKT